MTGSSPWNVQHESPAPGPSATVIAIDITDDDGIVAICRRGRGELGIALLDLAMPDPRPGGREWVEVHRHWARPR